MANADDEHYCQCLLDDTLLLLKQLLKVSPLESLVLYSRPQLGTRLTELSLPLLLPSCGISGPATHGFPDGGIPHTQYQKWLRFCAEENMILNHGKDLQDHYVRGCHWEIVTTIWLMTWILIVGDSFPFPPLLSFYAHPTYYSYANSYVKDVPLKE